MSSAVYSDIDRKMELIRARLERDENLLQDFNSRLDVSWIYHDNALEGVVLTYHELRASIDEEIISDATLIPSYEDVKHHKASIEFVRQSAAKRKPPIGLEFLKRIYQLLNDEPVPKATKEKAKAPSAVQTVGLYRRDNPLHRLYFHEIAPPEKIGYHMRKLGQWLATEEVRRLHPVRRAAQAHHKLIGIYPWPKHSGRIARLLMNAMLLRDGYLPAVIHAIERQRYYEVLRHPPGALTTLVAESLNSTLDAALRYLEEVDAQGLRAAS
ncbi:MAG: Fic family protein [Deltaproteobacteria bacterium]|nr:Fic family protein [Deltaproteobacteria bacterium]